jgi:hypothetical protein
MTVFLTGAGLMAVILGLIWLTNRRRSPILARILLSEPVARLAVVGMACLAIGLLAMIAELFRL